MTLEGFSTQVSDAVTLQVLRPGEGFPTTLLSADETTVIIMFSEERQGQAAACHSRTWRIGHLYRLCRRSFDILVKDQPHPSQSQMKGRSPANTSQTLI